MRKIIYILFTFALLFLCADRLSAQGFWQPTAGPYGGDIRSIAVDPNNRIFAATSGGGVYLSTDNGASWSAKNIGLPIYFVSSLAINAAGTIFAGTTSDGLFRSTDQGETWKAINAGLTDTEVRAIAIGSSYIFVGTYTAGVYRSSDNGTTWKQVGFNESGEHVLTITVSGPRSLLVGTDISGVFRSTDNGDNWYSSSSGLTNLCVTSIAMVNPATFCAATLGGGVFTSADSGKSWDTYGGSIWQDVQALAMNASGYVFAGTSRRGVYRSTDKGKSWQSVSMGLDNMNVQTIASSSSAMFAGTYGGGVYKSSDLGNNWFGANNGLMNSFVFSLASNSSGHMYAGSGGAGILRSTDNGDSWTAVNTDLTFTYIPALAINSSGHIFAGTPGDGVFRSTDNGSSWIEANAWLTDLDVQALTLSRNGNIYAGTAGGSVYRWVDNANSWSQVAYGSDVILSLVTSPSGALFAGTSGGGIFRSTNNGLTWDSTRSRITVADVRCMAIDSSGRIFAGTSGGGVFRSTDNGVSWTPVSIGLPGGSGTYLQAIVVNPSGHLFAGCGSDGIFRSTDNGGSWKGVNTGLPNVEVMSLGVAPSGYVFAGMYGSGVYRTVLSTNSALAPTVTTAAASLLGVTTATLNGTVNPNGSPTTAYFEWGTSSTLATSSTTSPQSIGSGTNTQNVSAPLTGLTQNTIYYYRIVGQNAGGTPRGLILSFLTGVPSLPAAPTLLSPSDGTTGINIRPTLSWNVSPRSTKYHLQVSTVPSFTTTVFDDSTITSTKRQVGPLACNRMYYWRVSATNALGSSPYTTSWSFTTPPPPSFSTISVRSSFASPGSRPKGLAWDGASLWMVDNLQNVFKLDTSGNVLQTFKIGSFDQDLTWDGTGLWVGGGSKGTGTWRSGELKIDTLGNKLDSLDVLFWPLSGLEWDGKFFWISDYNSSLIYKVARNGTTLINFGVDVSSARPSSLSYDGVNLWVGSFNTLTKYSTTGQQLYRFNLSSIGITSTATAFVAWDGQSLWFAQSDEFTIIRLNVPYYYQAPSAPTLVSPSDGATSQPLNPTLVWNRSQDASTYRLQVSTNAAFTALVFNDSTITDTLRQVDGLSAGTTHYWRVDAKNAGGTSSYSGTRSFTTGTPAAKDYYVNASTGSNTATNGTQASPWKTITYALDQISGSGNTLNVAAGTYNTGLGETFPIMIKNGVSFSGAGIDAAILDAQGTNTVIKAVGISDPTTTVKGFTIQGGGNSNQGGGLLISAGSVLKVAGCKIKANTVSSTTSAKRYGGGIYILNSSPTIANCEISGNVVMATRAPTDPSDFGAYGAGVAIVGTSSPQLLQNIIRDNEVQNSPGALAYGAGVYVAGLATPLLEGNTILKNTLHRLYANSGTTLGAGIFIENSGGIFTGNTIASNGIKADYGSLTTSSGIYIAGLSSKPKILRNVVVNNTDHGIWCELSATPTIVNNTIVENTGDGIYLLGASPDSIVNNIVALNSNYGINESSTSSDPGKVWYNLFYANLAGLYRDEASTVYYSASTLNGGVSECKNNLEGDPLFVDRANGDYRLRSGSPAINAGDPGAALDPDGTRADLGALYYVPVTTVPSVPSLSSPSDGVSSQPITPSLTWVTSIGATQYHLQVSTTSAFTTLVVNDSSLTGTSKSVGPLATGTMHYWRVRAGSSAGWSSYSGSWSFTTLSSLPVVSTGAATNVASASAALNGNVNPNGLGTTAYFEWGTSSTLASPGTTSLQSIGSGANPVSVTDSIKGLTPNTTYYYRVVGQNAGGRSNGSILTFTTLSTGVFAAPSLASPADGSTGVSTSPTVNWNSSAGAASYQLQVSTSSTFSSTVLSQQGITGASYSVSGLLPSTTYYWRVNTTYTLGTSGWSSVWSFTTTLALLSAPSLVQPVNGATNQPISLTLSWNAVAGATTYRLQVDRASAFTAPVYENATITTTSQPVTSLQNNTMYYWRVSATNAGGTSGWSSVWSFTTSSPALAPVPVTTSATSVGATTATLNGSVNPNGSATTAWFEWGTTSVPTSFTKTPDQSIGAGTSSVAFNSDLTPLSPNTQYYYRVGAKNSAGTQTGSIVGFATTPVAPVLSTPASGASGQSVSPTLTWNSVAGVTYNLQISLNAACAPPYVLEDSSVTANSKSLSNLASNTTYYWRVRAKGSGGYGAWSWIFSFVTLGTRPVSSPGVSFPASPSASTDYRLVSFPGTSNLNVGQVLTGAQNTDWRIFRDNGTTEPNNLTELSSSSATSPGEGYWLVTKGTFNFSSTLTMPQLGTDGTYTMSVRSGWNIIGNPFDAPISWSVVKSDNATTANLWTYTGTGGYQQSSTLEPFKGYYFSSSSTTLKIRYPFPSLSVVPAPPPIIDWKLQLALETEGNDDSENYVGVAPMAKESVDDLDQPKPPRFMDQASLSLSVSAPNGEQQYMSSDFRPSVGAGQVWTVSISNPMRSKGKIRIIGVESVPSAAEIMLIDAQNTVPIDVRLKHELPISGSAQRMMFSLIVGERGFVRTQEAQLVPKEFELLQNYPNPFNPSTTISYKIPRVADVRLDVVSVLGQRLETLAQGTHTPGTYSATWSVVDQHGASGVYFARLLVDGKVVKSQKMTFLK